MPGDLEGNHADVGALEPTCRACFLWGAGASVSTQQQTRARLGTQIKGPSAGQSAAALSEEIVLIRHPAVAIERLGTHKPGRRLPHKVVEAQA